MSKNGTKHVQTALDTDEYESLREFADERGLTVKEATREALVEWVERQRRADPNDPAFTVLDDLDAPATETTDARAADDQVESWSGEDVDFELAENPPEE